MDEEILAKKLMELGRFDYSRREIATHSDIENVCMGHLNGLILLDGRVTGRGNYEAPIQGEDVTVNSYKIEEPGGKKIQTLHISYVVRKFREEGLRTQYHPNDIVCVSKPIRTGSIDNFSLVIKDVRKNTLVTFDFATEGDMLYIPRATKPASEYNPGGVYSKQNTDKQSHYQNPVPDPLDNLY